MNERLSCLVLPVVLALFQVSFQLMDLVVRGIVYRLPVLLDLNRISLRSLISATLSFSFVGLPLGVAYSSIA